MDSINPYNNSSKIQGQNPLGKSNTNQEPANIVQDALGLSLLFQLEYQNDNNNGNQTTGQMMAKYINDIVTSIEAEIKNGTASIADQELLSHLTASSGGNPSLATLAASIVAQANQNPPVLDTTDIQTLSNSFQNGPGALVVSQLTNTSDSAYWFNTNNTNASYSWSGDTSLIQGLISAFQNSSTSFIDGMENSNYSLSEQIQNAQAYAQSFMNIYHAMNASPSTPPNPFVGILNDYMNTLVPGQGNTTILDVMNEFTGSGTPTQADLTALLQVLEPGGGDSQNCGFESVMENLLQVMGNSGIFSNGPFIS